MTEKIKEKQKKQALEMVEKMMENNAWGSINFIFENGQIKHSEKKETEKKAWS